MKRQTSPGNPSSLAPYKAEALVALVLLVGLLVVPSRAQVQGGYWRASYVLPAELRKEGLIFADVRIPLDREDVSVRVVEQMNFLLMDRRASMMEWFDRLAQHSQPIKTVLAAEKVPSDLLYLSVLLSEFQPANKTAAGGIGWWALGAGGDGKGSSGNQWISTNDWEDRRDPEISTKIACSILDRLHRKKETTDWLLTICAYADGVEKLESAVKRAPGYSYWDMVVPPKSESLVPRLVALKIIDANRELYGVNVPTLPAVQFDRLDKVRLEKDLPLHVVAKWCHISPRAMWELNPGVEPGSGVLPKPDRRSPSGFPLRVPKGMSSRVLDLLVKEGYLKPQ
jgi:membrane-bound lytic murein transglycosylase D